MMPWEHKKILQHKHYILIFYCNFFYNDQFGYANLLMVFTNLGDMFISHSRQGSFFSVFRKEKCLLLNAKSKGASLSQNRRCSSFIVSVDKKKIIQKKNSPKRQLLALVPLPTFFFFLSSNSSSLNTLSATVGTSSSHSQTWNYFMSVCCCCCCKRILIS